MFFYQMRSLRRRIHPAKSEASPSRCKQEKKAQTMLRQLRPDPHQQLTKKSTTGPPSFNTNHRHHQGTALYHKVTQTDITVYNTVTTGRCRSLRFPSLLHFCCVCAPAQHSLDTRVFVYSLTLKVSESQKKLSPSLRCRWLQFGAGGPFLCQLNRRLNNARTLG